MPGATFTVAGVNACSGCRRAVEPVGHAAAVAEVEAEAGVAVGAAEAEAAAEVAAAATLLDGEVTPMNSGCGSQIGGLATGENDLQAPGECAFGAR